MVPIAAKCIAAVATIIAAVLTVKVLRTAITIVSLALVLSWFGPPISDFYIKWNRDRSGESRQDRQLELEIDILAQQHEIVKLTLAYGHQLEILKLEQAKLDKIQATVTAREKLASVEVAKRRAAADLARMQVRREEAERVKAEKIAELDALVRENGMRILKNRAMLNEP